MPVRDEAVHLPRFLDALARQTKRDFVLCVLYDGCTDDSDAIVEARAGDLPFSVHTAHLERGAPNAGRARRAAMDLGLSQVAQDGSILSTDADSVPDREWFAASVAALRGADVVTGRILRDAAFVSSVQDRVETYYDALFRLRRAIDPVPWEAQNTHHYTSGASMAFRAAAYRSLGGFEPVAAAEDARIVDTAHRDGLRVRRDDAIRVVTSSRLVGRAINGLADHLRQLGEHDASPPRMAHPADSAWRYAGHAAARRAWGRLPAQLESLGARLGVKGDTIEKVADTAPNAEAFATRIVPDVLGGERIVDLDEAEEALKEVYREVEAA